MKIKTFLMDSSNNTDSLKTENVENGPKLAYNTASTISSFSRALATDSSSLVDLKAEVYRKQQEAKFNKIHGNGSLKLKNSDSKGKKSNKDKIWSKKNAGLTEREKRDLQVETEKNLKIQNALEEKAILYDKLNSGEIEHDGRFLVNFNKTDKREYFSEEDEDKTKELNKDSPVYDENERWVEYQDSLGRTRIAMKKDLPSLKSQDIDLQHADSRRNSSVDVVTEPSNLQQSVKVSPKANDEKSMLSEDMRRELLRQKWEKEEEENLRKTKVHYKDVLFDEARTHGAAFYKFSRNESERTTEMEHLQDMHKETEKGRLKFTGSP